LLVKAIAECTGRLPAKIKADYKKEGDLGLVAMVSRLVLFALFLRDWVGRWVSEWEVGWGLRKG